MSETATNSRRGEPYSAGVNQATGTADYEPDWLKLSVAMGTVLLSAIIDTTNKNYNQEVSEARSTSSRTEFKGRHIITEELTAIFFTNIFQVPLSLIQLSLNKLAQLLERVKSNLPEIQTCVFLQEQVQLKQSLTPDHTLHFQLNPHKLFSIPNLHKKKKKNNNIIYHYD